ncbi:MAG TPA: hypothetical protein VLG66_10095 [Alphaproteobacteria bacterium]|nr:hypothetical protein [Alphaproteobacteria bacterium]
MIEAREIVSSLFGAWRLVQRDPGGLRYFDASIGGFWRSFFAAVIALPGYVVLVAVRIGDRLTADGALHALTLEALAYAIGWTAFPLAAFYAVRLFDRERRYIGYIVAYNWAAVLQVGLYVPTVLLVSFGIFPQPLDTVVALVVTIAVMIYQYYIARVALEVMPAQAVGFVALDLVISLVLHAVVETLQAPDLAP